MLSRVLTMVIEKLDACMEKMLEKFESRLDRMYGDFATAQCRIDTLEQLLEKAQVPTPVVEATSTVWPSIIRPTGRHHFDRCQTAGIGSCYHQGW